MRGNLAATHLAAGQIVTAATELAGLIDDRCRVLGTEHPATHNARLTLAMALSALGHRELTIDCEPVHAQLHTVHRPRHPLSRLCHSLLTDARTS